MSSLLSSTPIAESETSVVLVVESFCKEQTPKKTSPIDDAIAYFGFVLRLADEERLASSDVLGRVLLLGLVSGTETYFRTVIARLVRICPMSRANASTQSVSFGAIDYYGPDDIGLGLMEGISFAGEGEVTKQTKRITGISIDPKDTSLTEAIIEFEKLAHLRHAAVHSNGELSPRNTQSLGMVTSKRHSLVVRFAQLHEAAGVCINAIRAYNRFMFRQTVQRWINKPHFTGVWERDRSEFCKVLALFRCRGEYFGGPSYARRIYQRLEPGIAQRLAELTPPPSPSA